jgi:hypothetical protein
MNDDYRGKFAGRFWATKISEHFPGFTRILRITRDKLRIIRIDLRRVKGRREERSEKRVRGG